jgi:hypothetical protein
VWSQDVAGGHGGEEGATVVERRCTM